jgi:hypothetical protein
MTAVADRFAGTVPKDVASLWVFPGGYFGYSAARQLWRDLRATTRRRIEREIRTVARRFPAPSLIALGVDGYTSQQAWVVGRRRSGVDISRITRGESSLAERQFTIGPARVAFFICGEFTGSYTQANGPFCTDVDKLVAALTLGLFAALLTADAQQSGKVYRIGFLLTGSRGPSEHLFQAFEQALRERGWVTGENLVIASRYAEGKYDRLPALAAELVRVEPQVIVAVPTAAARSARDATSTIPIVMLFVSDPIGEGLIASFARPGGNVTGLTFDVDATVWGKRADQVFE